MKYLILMLLSFNAMGFEFPERIKLRKYNLKEATAIGMAKEMCSCLFVANMSKEYCDRVTAETQIFGKYIVINKKDQKYVVSKGMGYRAFAYFDIQRPQYGCKVTNLQKRSRVFKGWYNISDQENAKKIKKGLNQKLWQVMCLKIRRFLSIRESLILNKTK